MKLLLLILLISISLYPQISPGDLTNAHSKYEGISNCTKCHVLGKQVDNSRCLDCHNDIKDLISSGRGYHSSGDVKGKTCSQCHSEHHGRNFKIINFNKDNFDHKKTLFDLTGKHSKTQCFGCHQQKYIRYKSAKLLNNTYLGLDMNCISCHEDFHQGTLSNDCINCHNTEAFKPAPKFNHNNSQFKLTGSHIKVECVKCHIWVIKDGKDYQKFKGILYSSCINCHKDVHQGKFGNECKSCHETSTFKKINQQAVNHDKTNYPLIGKHRSVACQACHKNDLNSKPKYKKCIDCHSDYHKGDFVVNGEVKDCRDCHNEFGYSPSQFTIENHDKTSYKLTGSHLAVSCRSCHFNNDSWHFKNIGNNCIDCHKNVHGNELNAHIMPDNDCRVCHETNNWYSIQYDHNKTAFKLIGKHMSVECGKCHHKDENGKSVYKFVSTKSECFNCHKDIHFGQFKDSMCTNCHGFVNWIPETFDHNKTAFPLEGAHKNLFCNSCHKKTEVEGNTFVKYKLENFKCAACHS
ncbi:MAG: cytochrome c3 family protein [Ignavibacteriaceae bacterium]|nr:cytochrome c3 family protein [Ignavibacteriaceae bacterium]